MLEEYVETVEDDGDLFEYCVMGKRDGHWSEDEHEEKGGEQDQAEDAEEAERAGEEARAAARSEAYEGECP